MPALKPGLYERLVTRELADELEAIRESLRETAPLRADSSHDVIARALQPRLYAALKSLGGDDRVARQVALANRVLEVLRSVEKGGTTSGDSLPVHPEQLFAILEPVPPPKVPRAPTRPKIPLSASDLLVNARHDLSLGPELKRELASADRVDLLCSFIKWSGLRVVEHALADMLTRRPNSVRVITTTYMGATQRRALERLVELGADVRVSYDRGRTRLHAKAWLFHRDSGFSTGYVGSSNLSASAVLDGLEWNLRFSQVDNPAILQKFIAAFTQYWDDDEFRRYDAAEFEREAQHHRRKTAALYLRLDLEPRPHQRQILEELAAERSYGHWRNLVVAATGTGKTVVAALDYRRLRRELERARLLFVAHRREILQQSQATFQIALRDGAFGELLGGGLVPNDWQHVFANIQSLTPDRLAAVEPDWFDVVIIDEFHHAAAATYDRLLQKIRPRVLLGLTATPERADGKSVLHWFDGRVASEMRLWTALDQSLLCPFQYFGVGGGPDLRGVKWSRGRYDPAALSNVYTADHLFAKRVLQETHAKVRDVHTMRALGFCVDLAHAAFMRDQFNKAGVKALVVSGRSSARERDEALRALESQELQILFTVDLFNEGVDLPSVDTLLFLRPTESATVFLQQLGRGLRRASDKECCTVLDFIGHAHRRFRFDARYRAIVGGTRRQLERTIKGGFPSLPSGCVIQLDRVAQEVVLENIRTSIRAGRKDLIEDLRALARDGERPTLRAFLDETGLDLEDLYTNAWSWTALLREAGIESSAANPNDATVERAFARMLHIDDDRLERFDALLGLPRPPKADASDPYQRLLFILTGHVRLPFDKLGDVWARLWSRAHLRRELQELIEVLKDRRRHVPRPLGATLTELPLRVHGTYSRDEVFAAFDERSSKNGVKRTQGGIYNARRHKSELLFVELDKRDKDYTPSTLYNDYPVTPTQFHWESQASCHERTPAGKRYLNATPDRDQNVLLFVRQRRLDARGQVNPYLLLGLCDLLSYRGARPMQIDWRLRVPMPAWFYQETKVAGG